MAIRILTDSIRLGNLILTETANGISFTGSANVAMIGFAPALGTNIGYFSGGGSNIIDKFPFATTGNATDHADLTGSKLNSTGQSSQNHGYASGTYDGPGGQVFNIIEKFSFSTVSNATDVGDLTEARGGTAGQSSTTHGYNAGGGLFAGSNTIDKFQFAADVNATNVGDLTVARLSTSGQNSSTVGYTSGGSPSSPPGGVVNTIDRFPFATDTNASDVGDMTGARLSMSGSSSFVSGYVVGGDWGPGSGTSTAIDKFPFATVNNATLVGNLIEARSGAGVSSESFGHTAGGRTGAASVTNSIERFPFATDTNASDVGDLTRATRGMSGQQD